MPRPYPSIVTSIASCTHPKPIARMPRPYTSIVTSTDPITRRGVAFGKSPPAPTQNRSNQMILIGTPAWVKKIIHLMHVARITEVRDWSRLMPTRNPEEVISLMQHPRVEE